MAALTAALTAAPTTAPTAAPTAAPTTGGICYLSIPSMYVFLVTAPLLYPSKVLLNGILRVSLSNLLWLGLALLCAILGGPLTAADSAMAPNCMIHSGRTVDSSQFVLSYLELVSRSWAGDNYEPSNFVSSVFDGKIKVYDTHLPHLHPCY